MDAGYTPGGGRGYMTALKYIFILYSNRIVMHLTLQLLCVALISWTLRSRHTKHLHTVFCRDTAILFSSDYLTYSNTNLYIIEVLRLI